MKLDLLDIEQCPSDFYASNAFMSTARCDYESTYVSSSSPRGMGSLGFPRGMVRGREEGVASIGTSGIITAQHM